MTSRLLCNGIGLLLLTSPVVASAQVEAGTSTTSSFRGETLAKQKKLNAELAAKAKKSGTVLPRIAEDGIEGPATRAAEKALGSK